MGATTRRKGRGILTISPTKLFLVLILAVGVTGLLVAQDSVPSDGDAGVRTRVDETTLLLDGTSTTGEDGPSVAVSPFSLWDLVRMLLVLGAVIGVIYFVFFLLKRGGKGKFAQNDSIKVIGAQSLPGNRNLYLVEVGSQVFLVGSGGDSVGLISEITDKETVDAMILQAGQNGAGTRRTFGDLVGGMFKGRESQSLGFMREQRERLQKMGRQ